MTVKKLIILVGLLATVFLAGCADDADKKTGATQETLAATCGGAVLTVGTKCGDSIAPLSRNTYTFTAEADGVHTITLSVTESDLSWYLVQTMQICDNSLLAVKESCQTSALSLGVTYTVEVDEYESVAGSYNILVAGP
ncbi:MAG: hypothetical protein OEZ59_11645 [Deltaproteobacteria bacterium]|nr:hypothetical protein [Deltaproteobacteria bacterium]